MGGGSVRVTWATQLPCGHMRILARVVSPAGFMIALLFFLLPFVAVSCEAPQDAGSIEASYTGYDLVLGADPTVTTTGELSEGDEPFEPDELPRPGVQVPATIALVLIGAGLAASLAPALRSRPLVLAGGATLAAAVLLGTELLARSNLKASVQDLAGPSTRIGGETLAVTDEVAGDLVEARPGFWLTLGALVLVALWSLVLAVRARSRK
jgi:hypothetical protein